MRAATGAVRGLPARPLGRSSKTWPEGRQTSSWVPSPVDRPWFIFSGSPSTSPPPPAKMSTGLPPGPHPWRCVGSPSCLKPLPRSVSSLVSCLFYSLSQSPASRSLRFSFVGLSPSLGHSQAPGHLRTLGSSLLWPYPVSPDKLTASPKLHDPSASGC